MSNNKIFALRLKQLRKKNDLSMDGLAKAVGLKSGTSIHRYEAGNGMPSSPVLNLLADFFGVDREYLEGITDVPRSSVLDQSLNTPEAEPEQPHEFKYNINTVGERLRMLRKLKDMSIEAVASHLDMSPALLGSIETGKRAIDLDKLISFALYYGTSLEYLLGATDDPMPYTQVVAKYSGEYLGEKWEDKIQGLDQESVEELNKYLKYLKARKILSKTDSADNSDQILKNRK